MSEIEHLKKVAASNNDPVPDGAPEGWPPDEANNVIRELMAKLARFYEEPEWLDLFDPLGPRPATTSRASASTVLIAGVDATLYMVDGQRIRLTGGGEEKGLIVSMVFSSPDTTVTVNLDGGNVVPVGTDTLEAFFSKELGAAAFGGLDFIAIEVFNT